MDDDFRAFVARGYPGFREEKGVQFHQEGGRETHKAMLATPRLGPRDCKYAPRNWPDWLKRDVELVYQEKAPITTQVTGSLVVQVPDASPSQSQPAVTARVDCTTARQ